MHEGNKRRPGGVLLLAGLMVLLACTRPQAQPPAPPSPLKASAPLVILTNASGQETAVRVELARTRAQRERGLMFRRELAPDAGMLFIFPDESFHRFWMKNTWIPLELIFLNSQKEIVGIVARARPESLDQLSVDRPARFVLEVNAGFSEAQGLAAGDRAKFIGIEE